MTIKARIKRHYRLNYNSSPAKVSGADIKVLLAEKCRCGYCHKSIFKMTDFPEIRDGEVMCEECYDRVKCIRCEICEESFEDIDGPQNYFFVVSKSVVDEYNLDITPGIYRALAFPIFRACLVGGFEGFFEENIQLVRAVDIEAELESDEIGGDRICRNCFERYSKTPV